MHVAEIWRYPVKSLAGERLEEAELRADGLVGDRLVQVRNGAGRIVTSRIRPGLLSLRGTLAPDGTPLVDGHRWDSPEARGRIKAHAFDDAEPVLDDDLAARFDVLPLSVATDGAIAALGHDGRRLRPNLVIGGVDGLAERLWPGRMLKLRGGEVWLTAARLRGRCVMTTFDPDTQEQDRSVLQRIVDDFDGSFALDCAVVKPGAIRVGDEVELRPSL